jgi:hypothetical protein
MVKDKRYTFSAKKTICPVCGGNDFSAITHNEGVLNTNGGGHCFNEGVTHYPTKTPEQKAEAYRKQADWRESVLNAPVKPVKKESAQQFISFETYQNLHAIRRLNDKSVLPFNEVFLKGTLGINYAQQEGAFIGSDRIGTLFFCVNENFQIVNAKRIAYKPNGKRYRKNDFKDNTLPKEYGEWWLRSSKDGNYKTNCLWGAWQLTDLSTWPESTFKSILAERQARPVAIVESEKTALVMMFAQPFNGFNPANFLWLSCGGSTNLTLEKARVLAGRKVFIMFDADESGRKGSVTAQKNCIAAGADAEVLDLFPERNDKHDILDEYLAGRGN